MANKMTRDERRAMNAAAKKAEKDARERRKSSQNPDTSTPDDEFSNPAPDLDDVLYPNSTPDTNDPPVADPPAPNAPDTTPDTAPEGDGGQAVKTATPIFPFPERTTFFWIYIGEKDPNDKTKLPPFIKERDKKLFILQDVWTFRANTEEIARRGNVDGSWIEYALGLEKDGQLELDVKYVDAAGNPIYDLEVPQEVADANKEDFHRLATLFLAKNHNSVANIANQIIASNDPDSFKEVVSQMSQTELSAYAADMEKIMQSVRQSSDSSTPSQPSPTEDPPTQP